VDGLLAIGLTLPVIAAADLNAQGAGPFFHRRVQLLDHFERRLQRMGLRVLGMRRAAMVALDVVLDGKLPVGVDSSRCATFASSQPY
jgi:hypothetical protein